MERFSIGKATAPLFLALLAPLSNAQDVLYSTFPGPEVGGPCFGDTQLAATGVQVPSGPDFVLGDIEVRLHDVSNSPNTPFSIDLYDNDGGNPGVAIAALGGGEGTWDGSQTFDTYTVTPPSTTVLNSGQTYWVVLSSSGPTSCEFGWSDSGTDPAGSTLSYVGERQGSSGSWNNQDGEFQQLVLTAAGSLTSQAVPVLGWPAVLLLSLLAAAIGARRLKR